MNENEKKFFYLLESMRDGCTRDVLGDSLPKEEVEDMASRFLKSEYIYETDGLIFINYEKVEVDCWNDVRIK
jgi:hypothetical protein